jgi:hypothetical protein
MCCTASYFDSILAEFAALLITRPSVPSRIKHSDDGSGTAEETDPAVTSLNDVAELHIALSHVASAEKKAVMGTVPPDAVRGESKPKPSSLVPVKLAKLAFGTTARIKSVGPNTGASARYVAPATEPPAVVMLTALYKLIAAS